MKSKIVGKKEEEVKISILKQKFEVPRSANNLRKEARNKISYYFRYNLASLLIFMGRKSAYYENGQKNIFNKVKYLIFILHF